MCRFRMTLKGTIAVAFFLSLLTLTSTCFAATYYVRTNGSDSCNGLSDTGGSSGNCAKRTIQAGVNLADAGDTVLVHGGSYGTTFAAARSGTSGSPITIQVATGETASVTRITVAYNYNIISGFRVTGSGGLSSPGIYITGSYSQAINNTIVGNGTPLGTPNGDCTGIRVGGSYNTVSKNIFDGMGNGTTTSFARAIHISGSNNQITDNTIKETNSIERAFEAYGTAQRIANNEIKNCKWTIKGPHPDVFQIFGGSNSEVIVENNYIHDFDGQLGNLETSGGSKNWTFRNNVFANVTREIFARWSTGYSGPAYVYVNFYNNTFYNSVKENTGWPIYTAYGGTSIIVKNNAFIACGTSTTNGWYNGSGTKNYNFVAHTATGGAKSNFSEPNGVNGSDPQLITVSNNCSTSTCDFHIGPLSALIDRATVISDFTTDKDEATRGAVWDIGAYEYASGVSLSRPMPPINLHVN